MLQIADTFLLGAYRKVARSYQMVTSPMTSRDLWRHSRDVTTFNMLYLRQFLSELDHIITQCSTA